MWRLWFGRLRALLLLAVVVTFLVVLCVQIVSGDATHGQARTLSVFIGLVYLLSWPPMRVRAGERGRAPVAGGLLIALAWPARMATAIMLTLLVAGHAYRAVFDREVAGFVLVGGLIGLVLLAGAQLAGTRRTTRREWLRSVVNIPLMVAIGGFAQPLKIAAFYLLCWVPLAAYHGVADGTGARWFGVVVDIPVWGLWLALVTYVVIRLRAMLNRLLGPGNALSGWLGDLKAEGDGAKAEVRTKPAHTASVGIAPGLSQDWDPFDVPDDAGLWEPRRRWRKRRR